VSFLPEKEGEAKYFDNFIITRKSSSHETDKIVVSLKHKVLEDTKILNSYTINGKQKNTALLECFQDPIKLYKGARVMPLTH
jgi:hypothetical protein